MHVISRHDRYMTCDCKMKKILILAQNIAKPMNRFICSQKYPTGRELVSLNLKYQFE